MADQPSREEQIVNAALQFAMREERAAYLKGACAGDAALLQRVKALLKAREQADPSLDPDVTVNSPSEPDLPVVEPLTEKPGDRIGRYKLLQEIGEGGCGVVYMAEQEEPVRRRVALKVIKLGMDTKQVIARFEAERQALALMDHPNIAKVLDAGATETGRPYFVMELVRGVPITEYCDQNNLSTRERLHLFIEICKAIQHAHQKGIIHRDIKPSNVLVTLHDGVPVPKVIDFGIAKATTGQRLTDKTLFTAFEQFIGTPAYMSPEQAEMSGLDVDTRSDIYALGVLLYELLAGRTPFDAKRLLEAGIDEIRRIIREEEPPRPSTRISTLVASEQTTVAKRRGSEPPKLIHMVRGDLDWIVMKAMEKDRTRRYDTANGLAMDITRFLDNEPIVARPPSNFYRFQKLVRRNKLAFGAATAVVATLVGGLGASTWLYVEEKAARQRADVAEKTERQLRQQAEADEKKTKTEATKSQQVARFLEDMLNGVAPSLALGRDTRMLPEIILDKTAERLNKDLEDQPDLQAELRTTLGGVYWALGRYGKAEPMLREALATRRKLLGNEHPSVALSLGSLANMLRAEGKLAEAETLYREALAIQRKVLGEENPDVATSLYGLARVLHADGKLDEAKAIYYEAAEWGNPQTQNEVAWILATCLELNLRDGAAAVSFAERAVAATNRQDPEILDTLAAAYAETGQFAEAVAVENEAITVLGASENAPGFDSRLKLYELRLDESITGCQSQMDICGYRTDKEDLVFDFDPRVFFMQVDPDAEVMVAGEFNHWLDNDSGRITNSYPQWAMQRIDENHYTLRKKIADFRERLQWQFRFVVNRNQWVEVPASAQNRGDLGGGNANLVLAIPPPATNTAVNVQIQSGPSLVFSNRSAANVLLNPGFETDADSNGPNATTITGWSVGSGVASNKEESSYPNPTHRGIGALRLYDNDASVPVVFQGDPSSPNPIPVTPGQVWDLQGYAYVSSTDSPIQSSSVGLIKIVWNDASGSPLQPIWPDTNSIGTAVSGAYPGIESAHVTATSPQNSWILLEARGTVPTGAAFVEVLNILVGESPGGAMRFDDISLTQPTSIVGWQNLGAVFPSNDNTRNRHGVGP